MYEEMLHIVPTLYTSMFQYDCYLSCSCLCSISLLVSEPDATGVEKTLRTTWVVDERDRGGESGGGGGGGGGGQKGEGEGDKGERVRGTEEREGITVRTLGISGQICIVHYVCLRAQFETWGLPTVLPCLELYHMVTCMQSDPHT